VTTPDPADNGSQQRRDQPGQQPEDDGPAHPSGVPATGGPWAVPGEEAAWARPDEGWAATDDPELWAPGGGPASPSPLPPPLDNSRTLGDEPLDDPTPRTLLNGTPLGPQTIPPQAAGSSPDETPTAPQPALSTPDTTPTTRTDAPDARPPGVPSTGGDDPTATLEAPVSTLGTPAGRGDQPDSSPPWSTPEFPATTPPIGAHDEPPPAPPPIHPQPPAGSPPAAGPPPPPWGPGPGGGYPPPGGPPPDRRLPIIIGIVAVLLLCCCAGAIGSLLAWGDDVYREMRDRTRQTVGLHEPGRDGDFEFQVSALECGIGRIGDPFVSQAAAGQYCLVEVSVRNVGDRPVPLSESLQKAYGPSGKQFGTDSNAVLLANAEQPVFLIDINPGNEVTGILVYDIPTDTQIVKLELHAAEKSRGLFVRTG